MKFWLKSAIYLLVGRHNISHTTCSYKLSKVIALHHLTGKFPLTNVAGCDTLWLELYDKIWIQVRVEPQPRILNQWHRMPGLWVSYFVLQEWRYLYNIFSLFYMVYDISDRFNIVHCTSEKWFLTFLVLINEKDRWRHVNLF